MNEETKIDQELVEKPDPKAAIERLTDDATLEEVVATVNQIIEKLDYYLSEDGLKHIDKRAVAAINREFERGASRSGRKTPVNPFIRRNMNIES